MLVTKTSGLEKLHETGEGPGFDAFHFHVSLKIEFWEGQEGFVLRSGGQSTGAVGVLLGWRPLPKLGDGTPTRAGEAGTLGVRSMFWPAEPVKT